MPLSICTFWELYDGIVPLILRIPKIGDTLSGVVMALDNILRCSCFRFSVVDNANTRLGGRTPL